MPRVHARLKGEVTFLSPGTLRPTLRRRQEDSKLRVWGWRLLKSTMVQRFINFENSCIRQNTDSTTKYGVPSRIWPLGLDKTDICSGKFLHYPRMPSYGVCGWAGERPPEATAVIFYKNYAVHLLLISIPLFFSPASLFFVYYISKWTRNKNAALFLAPALVLIG